MRLVFLQKVDERVGIQPAWREKFEGLLNGLKGWVGR